MIGIGSRRQQRHLQPAEHGVDALILQIHDLGQADGGVAVHSLWTNEVIRKRASYRRQVARLDARLQLRDVLP